MMNRACSKTPSRSWRNLTLAIGAVVTSTAASAQWTTIGSRIYYDSGYVGVGTPNPLYPLDVRSERSRSLSLTNNRATGTVYGTYSVVKSVNGRGLYGLANNVNGNGYGVFGVSNGRKGRGVYGFANNSTANLASYGVYGRTLSSNGAGVFGEGNDGVGVWGTTTSTANGSQTGANSVAGVRGIVDRTAPGTWSAGVWGINNGTADRGVGVAGYHAGSGFGVYGQVADNAGWAGYFMGGRNYFEGEVGIGTSEPAHMLDVEGDIKIRSEDRIYFGDPNENTDPIYLERSNPGSNDTYLDVVIGNDNGGSQTDWFRITADNDDSLALWFGSDGTAWKPGGGAWAATSDRRLKRDIQPLEGSLDRLLQLRGTTFYYKDPSMRGAGPGQWTGFIAQEVESVFPEWVSEYDGYKSLSIHGFEAHTVEALRTLREEKDAQIKALQAQNDELLERLERLEAMMLER